MHSHIYTLTHINITFTHVYNTHTHPHMLAFADIDICGWLQRRVRERSWKAEATSSYAPA